MKKYILLLLLAPLFISCDSKPNSEQKFTQKVSKIATPNPEAGKKLYKKCIQCHGVKAEEKAVGVGKVIAKWSKQKLINSMEGYKKRTYGGSMKGVMYKYVDKLSKEQIEQIADYIVFINK